MVGHSYIVYAPLLAGCTTVLYEGKPVRTPDPGAFWRVCAEHAVQALFAAPTAFRAIKKEDAEGRHIARHDLSKLKAVFVAGERLDPPTLEWLQGHLDRPVLDHWWQTETGWAICANPWGLEPHPVKPGSATLPVPGFAVEVLNEAGDPLPAGSQGYLAVRLPLPPGCLATVWRDADRCRRDYLERFPGYYLSGDGGYRDEEGYVYVMGRIDDVMNVAGHRLSTGEFEEVIADHPAVAECAVIARRDELKGELPLGLVLLKDGTKMDARLLEQELVERVRQHIGAVACFKTVVIVPRLPKTRSGKILRRTLRALVNGDPYTVPSTIDDPGALEEIRGVLDAAR